MKRSYLSILSFFAFIFILFSCTKEGPVGPAGATGATGANGPAGTPGSSTIITDSFYVSSSAWVNSGVNLWSYTYSDSDFAQDVVSKGVIQVSGWYPSGNYWIAWPYTSSIGGTYHYNYFLNTLVLKIDNVTPPAASFKLVIIK